jgi:alpha-mannosidase
MRKVHLIANAHLDPVWLWEWEEGAAEALSTFRIAAEFCENNEGFVFNHNEVILYRWIEEYDPELFERIRELVRAGKWHIMGGWYLQPDCNMPSGESFVRQMLTGRVYFTEKFGVRPTTAINFDPFGHTRGLVQIMRKAGFDSYIFCRPEQNDCPLPAETFTWVGFDGSEVIAHRGFMLYNSHRGKAHEKVVQYLEANPGPFPGLVLWGVGNHGGGPSRLDLERLNNLNWERTDIDLIHSTPESYFADIGRTETPLPRHEGDLNPWGPGCYTSQIRIKQKHRRLENELYAVEKMVSAASLLGNMPYPKEELDDAFRDLLTAEFHDILPGSSIQPVEETSLRLLDHGLEIASRLKARSFFVLAKGQKAAEEGEIPVLVYNPHPFKVFGIFECEFQLADQNWNSEFSMPEVYWDGVRLPAQAEQEASNLNLDWRKRVVFAADLEPMKMNRFDCRIRVLPHKPLPALAADTGWITFDNGEMEVVINARTGWIDTYCVNGRDIVRPGMCEALVIEDDPDSWGSSVRSFPKVIGSFRLLDPVEGSRYSGISAETVVESVRVVEDGEVRSVVEAVFGFGHSFLRIAYSMPKQGTEIDLDVTVHWNEKGKMLKLQIPTSLSGSFPVGQVAYGRQRLFDDGTENVSQKWQSVESEADGLALTCINDGVHGSDFRDGALRVTLMRSAAYSALNLEGRPFMQQNRHVTFMEQGERKFRFWLNAGPLHIRRERIEREALTHHERPFALSYFPSGAGVNTDLEQPILPVLKLHDDNESIVMTAFKKAERSDRWIIRLFESTGNACETGFAAPLFGRTCQLVFSPFEIKTLGLDPVTGEMSEIELMEEL